MKKSKKVKSKRNPKKVKSKRNPKKVKSKRNSKKVKSKKINPKYERCVLAIKQKQPPKCFNGFKWIGGSGCANPWAICTAKVGRYLP